MPTPWPMVWKYSRHFETLPYDLVLMDIQMPEMDGIEATRNIRERKSANGISRIPVIAMTAHAMQGDRENFIKAGMNDYISKPVSPHALSEALKKWLPKKESMGDMAQHPDDSPPHVSSADTHFPIFDKAGLMARLMDDKDLTKMVIEGFLKDIPLQITALKGYLDAGDTEAETKQAHIIKGASANVGGGCT